MKLGTTTRRQMLRGAGGVTLALPFLPSLEPKALGQALGAPKRNFVAIATNHGGVTGANMFPADATLTTKFDLYPGHQVSYGPLTPTMNGTDAQLSPILTAKASALGASVLSKLNVLRGFGHSFHIVHHGAGQLGNFTQNNGSDSDQAAVAPYPFITIDQFMAWSPSFYPDLSGIKQRSMIWGELPSRVSSQYGNPAARTGAIRQTDQYGDLGRMFDAIFVKPTGTAPAPTRKPIVDGVLQAYRSLRDGNRRLSSGDRQRLDEHMAMMAELQRKLTVKPTASCSFGTRPVSENAPGYGSKTAKAQYQTWAELVAAAIICGSSRIAATIVTDDYYGYTGDWHQDVAHQYSTPAKQAMLVAAYRDVFENVFLNLANRLDVDNGTGSTYLDSSLITWTQESGKDTHDGNAIPIITAGRGAGFLTAGNYIDYRNRVSTSLVKFEQSLQNSDYAGLTYNRFLAIALQAMGVPRSEFERDGVQGYSHQYLGRDNKTVYVPGVVANASDVPRPLKA